MSLSTIVKMPENFSKENYEIESTIKAEKVHYDSDWTISDWSEARVIRKYLDNANKDFFIAYNRRLYRITGNDMERTIYIFKEL